MVHQILLQKLHISRICPKILLYPVTARINSCAWGSEWKIHTHCRILKVKKNTLSDTPGGKPHILTIIVSLHSGAMWALGLVVLLVTVAGVLALLVYVLKW